MLQDQYQIIDHEKITADYCIMNAVSLDTQNLFFIKFSSRCEQLAKEIMIIRSLQG